MYHKSLLQSNEDKKSYVVQLNPIT